MCINDRTRRECRRLIKYALAYFATDTLLRDIDEHGRRSIPISAALAAQLRPISAERREADLLFVGAQAPLCDRGTCATA